MNLIKVSFKAVTAIVIPAVVISLGSGEPIWAQTKVLDATRASFAKTGPKSSQARLLIIKASELVKSQHGEAALQLLNKAILIEPTNAWPYFYRAEALKLSSVDRSEISLVVADYEAAIKRNPSLEEPYCCLAILYAESNNSDMAFKTLARMPKSHVPSIFADSALAEIYANDEKYDKAIPQFTRLIKSDPKNWEYLRKRAVCFAAIKKFPQAIVDYTALINSNRFDSDTLYFRASAYEQLGKWNEAASDYQRIIELNPRNDKGYVFHAAIMLRLNHLPEAISDYTKVLKFAPDDIDTLTSRGEAYLKLGDKVKALKDLSAAIDAEPESAKKAYLLRAKIYQSNSNISAAEADLSKAKRISRM